jgi:hypothetical protein
MKLIGIERELFGNSVNKVVGVLPERGAKRAKSSRALKLVAEVGSFPTN